MKLRAATAGLVVATAAWLAWTWLSDGLIRQDKVVRTLATMAVLGTVAALWLVFFSPLPRRVRAVVGVLLLVAGAALPALFRTRGLTGDLVPVIEPRWRRSAATATPAPVAATAPVVARPSAAAAAPRPASTAPATAAPAEPPLPAFPQFQGPGRDAMLSGPRLARDWTARPPRERWRRRVGEGWSGFAVAGGLALTQEQWGDEERVAAYDAATGEPRWSQPRRARYETMIAGTGPRATPTVHEGRVFAQGALGTLDALDLATGRRLWSRDVLADNGATLPEWGKSGSPLAIADRVVVNAGGGGGRSLVAYRAADGEPVWRAGSSRASYSSPTLMTLAGREQVVVLNQPDVSGHDPATGALLWQAPFPAGQPNVAVPLALSGDRLLVSVGYGVGSKLFRIAPDDTGTLAARLEWESPRLKSKFANLVRHRGDVYGLDDGVLTCIDPATGERRWKDGRYGHGQLLLVGDLLLVQAETGLLVLVDPSPDGLRELGRVPLLDGKTWNPPALAGRTLYVRNDREAAAYDLPVE